MTPTADFSTAISTFSGFLAILWLTWMYLKKKYSKLPPGPPGLPIVGNLLFLDPELHTYFAALAAKYGPVAKVRLGAKLVILISSPAAARQVMKDKDINFANRDVPAVVGPATYGGSDIVWAPLGPEWRMLRKVIVLKMLSKKTMDSVYPLRRRETRKTVDRIYKRVGSRVDIGEQVFLTILNVVTSMIWGGNVEDKIGTEFREIFVGITETIGSPDISDCFPGLARFDLQGMLKRMKILMVKMDEIFDKIIKQKGENGAEEKSKDFLQFMLKLKDENVGDSETPFTMNHLKAMLMDMTAGGSDTTATTIEFTMAEILNHPEVLTKVQSELDVVVGRKNIVEESHINKLPYLLAVIKESLRLHPVLPLLIPHCPAETTTVDGYTIPKGSRVLINVWKIHRDPLIWDNPLEFNPGRFFDSEFDFSGSDFRYLPFGSGRRICAGMAMAETMMLYTIATLLHSFDWNFPAGEEKVEISEKFGIVLKLKTPLVAIPTPRLSDPALFE